MSDPMEWKREDPQIAGYYWWCKREGSPLLIKVFGTSGPRGKMFTNWDGGAPVDDELFRTGFWWGPFQIDPPPPPE